jgi:hypothetical protein
MDACGRYGVFSPSAMFANLTFFHMGGGTGHKSELEPEENNGTPEPLMVN